MQELCNTLSFAPTILDKVITEFATLLLSQWCNPPREGTHAFHRTVSYQKRPQPLSVSHLPAPRGCVCFLQSSLGEIDWEDFDNEPNIWRDQGHPDVVTAFLMLEVLVGLSERAEMVSRVVLGQPGAGAECEAMAWFGLRVRMWGDCSKNPPCCGGALGWLPWEVSRHSLVRKWKLFFIKAKKIEAFLPSMMKILEVGSEDEKLKMVVIFQNVLGHLKKSKTSSIAVALVGKILPLFDSVRLMWETEPCRGALPHSSALKAALRAGSALREWILGFAAKSARARPAI